MLCYNKGNRLVAIYANLAIYAANILHVRSGAVGNVHGGLGHHFWRVDSALLHIQFVTEVSIF